MFKVIQPFFDGSSNSFYHEGLEIADDPRLAWAEKRGLVRKIEEEKPKAEAKKTETKKQPAKKTTKKSTTKK